MSDRSDRDYLELALQLAARAGRASAPNPRVGAVLVRSGEIVGEGWHRRAGSSHAEIEALAQAGVRAQGATLYVTLEPCCHHGRTPPCVDALLAAGVRRVVAACLDPDESAGGGLERLRAAGLEVAIEPLGGAAARSIEEYLLQRRCKRAFAALKVAATLDGKIADRWGQARWITSPAARTIGRGLRDRYSAILVGAGTIHADDPELLPPTSIAEQGAFWRCILDGALTISPRSRLFRSAGEVPVVVFGSARAPADRRTELERAGAEVVILPEADEGQIEPRALLEALGARGVLGVLIEGGGRTHAQFLAAGVADKLYWFLAPRLLGDRDGVSAVDGGPRALETSWNFSVAGLERVGDDIALTLYPRESSPPCSPD